MGTCSMLKLLDFHRWLANTGVQVCRHPALLFPLDTLSTSCQSIQDMRNSSLQARRGPRCSGLLQPATFVSSMGEQRHAGSKHPLPALTSRFPPSWQENPEPMAQGLTEESCDAPIPASMGSHSLDACPACRVLVPPVQRAQLIGSTASS